MTVNHGVPGSSPGGGAKVYALLAHLVEQPPCKRQVVSSNPTGGTNLSRGTSVVDYRAHNPEDGGSNPSPATSFGVWRSPVAHLVWDQGVQGSNPCTPTNSYRGVGEFGRPR